MLTLLIGQQKRVRLLVAVGTERLDRGADRRWVGKLGVHGGTLEETQAQSSPPSVTAAVW
jgi:hypothetical protein